MVLTYFTLREQPFGVTPDPKFLYASETHREALASLLYGVESGLGFVALTAMPGMGKTTLLFELLRRLQETRRTVFLFQSISSPADLVRALLIDLGIKEIGETLVDMQAQLNEVLVTQSGSGKSLVAVIDEAQNLNPSVLEAVRMLSNFETASHKLMQIVLCGQLQLAEQLATPQLLQLRQRISIVAYLKPLTAAETTAYIRHRLRISGRHSSEPIFTGAAIAAIARYSQGIPRNINNICFNALSLACALRRGSIDADLVREVVADLGQCQKHARAFHRGIARHVHGKRPPIGFSAGSVRAFSWAAGACAVVTCFIWLGIMDYRAITAENPVVASSNALTAAPAYPIAPPPASVRHTDPGSDQTSFRRDDPTTKSQSESNKSIVPGRDANKLN